MWVTLKLRLSGRQACHWAGALTFSKLQHLQSFNRRKGVRVGPRQGKDSSTQSVKAADMKYKGDMVNGLFPFWTTLCEKS